MKPLLKNSLLIVIGGIIGLLAGFFIFNQEKKAISDSKEKVQTKVVTKKIKDTVYIEKERIVEVNRFNDSVPNEDTLNLTVQEDTLSIGKMQDTTILASEDNEPDEDLQVFTDQLLKKVNIELEKIELDKDSLNTEQLFGLVTEKFNSSIAVEFWSSPLDLTGYELTRNKLKLYGFNPEEPVSLIYKEGEDFINLKINDINLKLAKTDRFKTLYF